MADVNAIIAQGVRPIKVLNPLDMEAAAAKISSARQEQELNALRMAAYQRGVEEQNALRRSLQESYNPETGEYDLTRARTLGGQYGADPMALQQFASGQETAAVRRENIAAQRAQREQTTEANKRNMIGSALMAAMRDSSDDNLTLINNTLQSSGINASKEISYLLGLPPEQRITALESLVRTSADARAILNEAAKAAAPKVVPGGGAVFVGGEFKTPPSMPAKPTNLQSDYAAAVQQGFRGSLVDFASAISEARRAPKTGGEGGTPKAPPGYRFTPEGNLEAIPGGPAAPKPMSAQQTEKLKADMSKNRSAAIDSIDKSDDILNVIQRISTAPGLSGATGLSARVFSMPEGPAARAETLMGELRGKVTGLGKAIASAGGAIGSIATQEWKILADMVANLDPTKGRNAYLEQLKQVELYAERVKGRVAEAYNTQYEDKFEQFPNFQLPKTPPTEAVNDLLAGKGTDAQFDAVFGPGAAARARKKGK